MLRRDSLGNGDLAGRAMINGEPSFLESIELRSLSIGDCRGLETVGWVLGKWTGAAEY